MCVTNSIYPMNHVWGGIVVAWQLSPPPWISLFFCCLVFSLFCFAAHTPSHVTSEFFTFTYPLTSGCQRCGPHILHRASAGEEHTSENEELSWTGHTTWSRTPNVSSDASWWCVVWLRNTLWSPSSMVSSLPCIHIATLLREGQFELEVLSGKSKSPSLRTSKTINFDNSVVFPRPTHFVVVKSSSVRKNK